MSSVNETPDEEVSTELSTTKEPGRQEQPSTASGNPDNSNEAASSTRTEPRVDVPGRTPGNAEASLVPFFDSRTSWDQATKRTATVILLVVGGLLFWLSRPVLPVLILAFIISYLLSPFVDLLERIRIPRGLSTVFLYLLLLVLFVLAPILLVPVLIDELSALVVVDVQRTTQSLVIATQNWLNGLPTELEVLGFGLTIEPIVSQVQSTISGEIAYQIVPSARDILEYFNRLITTTTNLVGSTAIIGFTLVGGIFNVFLFLIFLFFLSLYMTKDAPLIREYIEGLFPDSYHSEAVELIRQMSQIWQAFFRGQLLLSLVIGFITWGVLELVGMPGALLLAILAGALEVIPNVGPILAMIPAVIVALIQGSTVLEISNLAFSLLILGIYFVIQQLENQLLVPRIIGTSVNLHPIVVLCGVIVGASVGGILGALLAAPLIASLRVVGSYVHAKLLDYPPFLNQKLAQESRRKPSMYRRVVISDETEEKSQNEEPAEHSEPRTSGEFGRIAR